jgi:hypothetical protein
MNEPMNAFTSCVKGNVVAMGHSCFQQGNVHGIPATFFSVDIARVEFFLIPLFCSTLQDILNTLIDFSVEFDEKEFITFYLVETQIPVFAVSDDSF